MNGPALKKPEHVNDAIIQRIYKGYKKLEALYIGAWHRFFLEGSGMFMGDIF